MGVALPLPRLPPLRILGAIALVLASVAGCGTPREEGEEGEEDVAEGDGAQSAVLPDEIASIESSPNPTERFVKIGPTHVAVIGERVGELTVGRRYSLSLRPTREPKHEGLEVRMLLDLRPVLKLIGTLSDDARDATVMHLQSLHAKSYALVGDTVGGYKDIRANLPTHDYTATLFTVNAVQKGGGDTRWEWLDYTLVPRYECTQKTSASTHLDLVDVKPDASMLDGFISMPLGGREVRYGAHAACTREGPGYACALDSVGKAWGKTHFTPAASGPFELMVERTDAAATKLPFACETVAAASLVTQSED